MTYWWDDPNWLLTETQDYYGFGVRAIVMAIRGGTWADWLSVCVVLLFVGWIWWEQAHAPVYGPDE